MAIELTQTITNQITAKDIKQVTILTVDSVDLTDYLLTWTDSDDRTFGSASCSFVLNNDEGIFGEGGDNKINVGDVVEFSEKYGNDSTEFKRFYGFVNQRAINKTDTNRTITLTCLDYISSLQFLDINLKSEGTKVEITNETLTPNFLPAPNTSLAQLYDFANTAISVDPLPILMIKDLVHETYDPQYDGFEIYYQSGQVKLGSPLNADTNYSLIAKSYWFYTEGIYCEDVLEQILTQEDGYGGYLFGESSSADLITNHLTETYQNIEGAGQTNFMTPNYTSSTITIRTYVDGAIDEGDTSITLDSVEGLPTSGTGTINGDTFTWSGISTNTLTGIPATGDNSLSDHPDNSVFKYENTYDAGQVWYLKYSNLTSALDSEDFDLPSGSSLQYFDARYGRIILDSAISLSSTVECITNYTFKTLQATGVELNEISFLPRELENRMEAVTKLRDYLAPNYIIRTIGDNKIWSEYLSQKTSYDYNLTLIQSLNYLEDEDLYTRTKFYAKNRNPTNIVFNDGVDFFSTGETYKGLASQNELSYSGEEGNYYIYATTISNAGYIDLEDIKPIVYINDVTVDNAVHQMVGLSIIVDVTTKTVTRTGCHGISSEQYVKTHSYYYYRVKFAHSNIEPSQPVYIYDATGTLQVTISANDPTMDYARGEWVVPGEEQNSTIESLSTASYFVFYSTGAIQIDYDNVLFKINKSLIPDLNNAEVKATYEYWTVMIPIHDIASVIDGRWDTQVQVEFFSDPPSNYPLTILDLGATYDIQAMDVVAGFYKPDEIRKFDVEFNFTIQYSTDGTNYYEISDKTHNVKLNGGESKSFEEDDLGVGFQARYLKLLLNNVKEISYGDGVYVVAFSELSVYGNIIINSESTLIPTTTVTDSGGVGIPDSTLNVESTAGFTEPESSEEITAYISGDEFTYTGITADSFTGCTFTDSYDYGDRVSKSLADDTSIYDDDYLLPKLGDRLYKDMNVNEDRQYTQEELDRVSKAYLEEFYKNHTKVETQIMYAPYLKVGQTVRVVDTYNDISQNYFIESLMDNNGSYTITLARYPL